MPEKQGGIILERTSRGKAGGQDTDAQAADTAHRATLAGYGVLAVYKDDAVSGATPWAERKKGLVPALAHARELSMPLIVRHPDRLWRGVPEPGIIQVEREVPALEVLDNPRWARRDGEWLANDPSDRLSRYVDLWAAYRDREDDIDKSEKVTTAIREGRRPTKSGNPPHRPPTEIDAAHLDAARKVLAKGGRGALAEAHREVLRLRGWNDVKDERTRKTRYVSKSKLGEALGVYARVRRKGDSVAKGQGAEDAAL